MSVFKLTPAQTSLQRVYLISQVFHKHLQQWRLLAIDPARTRDHSSRNPEIHRRHRRLMPAWLRCLLTASVYLCFWHNSSTSSSSVAVAGMTSSRRCWRFCRAPARPPSIASAPPGTRDASELPSTAAPSCALTSRRVTPGAEICVAPACEGVHVKVVHNQL